MREHEGCKKDRTEKIIFRVKPSLKAFVREWAEMNGMDVSDFMRMMLNYFYMSYFSGTGSYEDIRSKFFAMFPNGAENDKQKKQDVLGK